MRYLVTGGAGFIGSHLTARLLGLGSEVVVLDDLSAGSLENLRACSGHPGVRFVHGSTADRGVTAPLVREVDAVFHLAAVVGVRRVLERPLVALRDNVLGAQAVLDAAALHGRPTLIASSSEVYGRNPAGPLAEDADVLVGSTRNGRWAYARSKVVTEAHGMAHHRAHGLPVVIARLFNTVGHRQTDRYGMVVPRFVEQALAGRDLTVYGDGRQSRCFCDVDDVVEALVGLLHEPAAVGESFTWAARSPPRSASSRRGSSRSPRRLPVCGWCPTTRPTGRASRISGLACPTPARSAGCSVGVRATTSTRRAASARRETLERPAGTRPALSPRGLVRSERREPADTVVDLAGHRLVDELGNGSGPHVGGMQARLDPVTDMRERRALRK